MQQLQALVSPASKKLRKLLGNKKKRLSLLLASLGILVFSFGLINYYRVRILSFSKVPASAQIKIKDIDAPVEIIIPSIKIDIPVDPAGITNGVWQISEKTATYLATSAPPGGSGNTVIYGHNKKAIFGNLPYLSVGQKITVKTKSGKIYNYQVTEKFFVRPDRVDLISPTDKEQLTIYTCWGIFDNERAVVKATPIN